MKKNMGTLDRQFRWLAAIIVLALVYFKVIEGTAAWMSSVMAIVFFVTGAFRFCPLYVPFHISTIKKSK